MITRHTCLDNEVRNGPEADCPTCRVLLLEAFRAPVQPPRFVPPPDPRRPHLLVPPEHSRTVEIPQLPQADCPRCGNGYLADRLNEHLRACDAGSPPPDPDWLDQDPDVAEHTTEHGVTPSDEEPGGLWWARCSCGWEANGPYTRTVATGTMAENFARTRADQHRKEAGQ